MAHYTTGRHSDSCGHWHPSGLHYNWSVVSFYNENEHRMGGPRYTRCLDQLRPLVDRISPGTTLEGPETVSSSHEVGAGDNSDYLDYLKSCCYSRYTLMLSGVWIQRSISATPLSPPREFKSASIWASAQP